MKNLIIAALIAALAVSVGWHIAATPRAPVEADSLTVEQRLAALESDAAAAKTAIRGIALARTEDFKRYLCGTWLFPHGTTTRNLNCPTGTPWDYDHAAFWTANCVPWGATGHARMDDETYRTGGKAAYQAENNVVIVASIHGGGRTDRLFCYKPA